jgi:hypothetical protein
VVLGPRFAEAVVVDEYTGSRFKSWDKILKNCDGVMRSQIMEYPPEEEYLTVVSSYLESMGLRDVSYHQRP